MLVLEHALKAGKKIPNCQPRSKPCYFVCKSTHHTASVSITSHPETNFVSPSFHTVHDDAFQTGMSKNGNILASNWRDMLAIDHCANNENLTSPLIYEVDGSATKVKFKINDASTSEGNTSREATSTVPTISEGDSTINDNSEYNVDDNSHSNVDNHATPSQKRDGSITQAKTTSGRTIIAPKMFMKAAFLGMLSFQIGSNK